MVSDATQEFTAPEMAFLRQAAALCPTVVCVLTKTDATRTGGPIAELDRGHLATAGIEAPVFPVSASLELLAVQRQDRELHEESAVGVLSAHLRTEVVDRAEALARRATAHDLTSVDRPARRWRCGPSWPRSEDPAGTSSWSRSWRRPGRASTTCAAGPPAGSRCSTTA